MGRHSTPVEVILRMLVIKHTSRSLISRQGVATGWYPPQVAIIAGAILYTRYPPLIRLLIRWFRARQGGDTDTHRDYVYTDWALVTAFADAVVRHLDAAPRR